MLLQNSWKTIIKPRTGWRDINLKEIWDYRNLVWLFVVRYFATMYKQTILGPLWILITPLITTCISTFVFGRIAKIPSDGVPYFIFYMCGHTVWEYFATCLTQTSNTFVTNANLFGKVYFPRLVVPTSVACTSLINFSIQMLQFVVFLLYFKFKGADLHPNVFICLLPILILQMALLGIGCGIIISSMTTKYRDLSLLVTFGVSMWMYVTPIIYSASTLSSGLRLLCMLNPIAPCIEIIRYAFLGTGSIPWNFWGISWVITFSILTFGVIIFSKVEKTFMDTV